MGKFGALNLVSPVVYMLLQINDNKITTLEDIEPQLKHIETLETIYLERNPVQASEGAAYRRKLILLLPQIQQLDATYVSLRFNHFSGADSIPRYVKQFPA